MEFVPTLNIFLLFRTFIEYINHKKEGQRERERARGPMSNISNCLLKALHFTTTQTPWEEKKTYCVHSNDCFFFLLLSMGEKGYIYMYTEVKRGCV